MYRYVCVLLNVCLCCLLGCPPLQGSEGGQQNFMGVLETALKLANQDAGAEDEEEVGPREAAKVRQIYSIALIYNTNE